MAAGHSNMSYYGSRGYRSRQSFDRYQPAMDSGNSNLTVSSSQHYDDQSYDQDYVEVYNQKYERGYGNFEQENATHKSGSFRGQNNYRGTARGQGQRGKKFTAEKNSTSSEFGFEGETFCNNPRPQFNHGQEQKPRNYVPKGNIGQEDNFHDRRDRQHYDESVSKRGSRWRQRGGANIQVDRFNAGDEHDASQNYHDAGQQEKSWRKTGARAFDSREPDDGLSKTSGIVSRERNENERFRGGNVRDGEGYNSRHGDLGWNRGQQNKSRKGSKNTQNASQRDAFKYENKPVEEVDRPSVDLHLVPEECNSDTVDLQISVRAESVDYSMENREFGAQKKFGNWRENGQGGKLENYVTPDGDQTSRGRRRGRRNRKGALEDRHEGETKDRVESERGHQDVESREDVGLKIGRTGFNEEDGEGENSRDSNFQRERRDVRSTMNYQNVSKDSKRETKGRWDNARYSSDYNNWGGNEGWKRPQQGANRQRVNLNDVQHGRYNSGVGDEQRIDLNDGEEHDRSKDTSTRKPGSREATKSKEAEMGSSKEGESWSSKISEGGQLKRTTRDKEEGFPRTANWQDETQRGLLIDQLCAGKYECLVCFNIVRSDTAVWSCSSCYHIYHLYCIKKWAQSSAATPVADGSGMAWRCPTCQSSYLQVPHQYNCFCGKQRDPELNRYATPHSCNETCSRERNRGCPHLCTLLCHPGPCPPCSAFVVRSCDCGKSKCSVKCVGDATSFKCTEPCGRTLNCGQHMCEEECHAGSCSACAVNIKRVCYCGHETRTVRCGSGEAFITGFTCGGTCGRRLRCERHDCVEKCHPGPCVDCPRMPDAVTRCACGKTPLLEILGVKQRETCEDPIATCDKVCDKELACGNEGSRHRCRHRCHEGPCPATCDRTTEVTCRCGAMTKEVSCMESLESSDTALFVCDRRCKKKMSCGRHRCNQTCCTIDEHLCQFSCGYKLSCGLHRCEEPCHKGNCPSCWQVSFDELRCFCGAQVIYPPVPCGTKPPECNRLCTRQHTCNHSATHHCHSEEVCPPCTVLTEKWCLGRHELRRNIPCYVVEISCGMQCGKELPCLVHKCQQSCHKGACLEGKVCTQPCPMIRSECGHPCQVPCHPGAPCPATVCRAEVTLQCDCGRRKEKGQCMRGHDASSQSDYSKMTAQLVASKLWEGQSIDLAVLCKELGNKKTRKLQCNSECSIQERNQRLALALEIKNPDLSSKLGNPTYSPFLKDFAKQNLTFVAGVEKALSDLVTASQQPKVARKIHSFKVMPSNQRRVVHELAEFYGCQTESYDEEPNKNVVASAVKDKCWLPSVTLTALVQRELFPKAPVPIPINCKEDQIRSAAQAAKQSTQVFSLSGASLSSSSRSNPGGQASGSASSNRRNNEPKIDYFDFTD